MNEAGGQAEPAVIVDPRRGPGDERSKEYAVPEGPMSFFEPPPPPPEEESRIPPQPMWIGPPDNVLGVGLPTRSSLPERTSWPC
jgi:hypothetical protein